MNKHILFVNATYPKKLRTLQTAKRLGMRVSVVGSEIAGWARPYVDAHIPSETHSVDATVRAVLDAARSDPFDGVITFWDRDVVVVAELAAALGLPGAPVAAARKARDKLAAREAYREQKVPHPPFASVTSWEDLVEAVRVIGYPLICKPVSASSSKGIFRITGESDLADAYHSLLASTAPGRDRMFGYNPGRYLAEGFMAGQEVSVEGIVVGGDVEVIGVTDKRVHGAYFTEYLHAFPACLPQGLADDVRMVAEAAIRALGLNNCGFHVEVMITVDGPQIVEVNGRLGGDLITTHLVPLASGVDLTAAALLLAVGEPVDLEATRSRGACVRFLVAERAGKVRSWTGLECLPSDPRVVEFGIEKRVGDCVELPPDRFADDRLCYVVTQGATTGEAVSAAEEVLSRVGCTLT